MSESVVITSVGAVTPVGRSVAEIVGSLRAGQSGVVQSRIEGLPDSCWFGQVETPPHSHSGEGADRALAFALDAAEDALKEARISPGQIAPERVGTIVSSSKGLLANALAARAACREEGPGAPARVASLFAAFPGDTVSRTIARTFGFSGPALSYPAACATGIASLVPAIHLLQEGTLDLVLAGSTEAAGNALVLAGFASMGALDSHLSRPFHVERNGFNAGEGAAVVVLERESDALRRGRIPLARIAGWDLRADGHSSTGVEPGGQALELAIRRTLHKAGWSPAEVDYINAHGTGTRLNDAVEAEVIGRLFGRPGGGCPIPPVSSLKPYVGHLLGASASVELALMLRAAGADFLPPTLRLDIPDPLLPLNHVPPSGRTCRARRLLKLSLGFGGHIGVLAVELLG